MLSLPNLNFWDKKKSRKELENQIFEIAGDKKNRIADTGKKKLELKKLQW